MDTLEKIREKINERRENSFDDYSDKEAHTDLREAGDADAPTPHFDEWLVEVAGDGFEPSPEKSTNPDVLVVTGDGIKER